MNIIIFINHQIVTSKIFFKLSWSYCLIHYFSNSGVPPLPPIWQILDIVEKFRSHSTKNREKQNWWRFSLVCTKLVQKVIIISNMMRLYEYRPCLDEALPRSPALSPALSHLLGIFNKKDPCLLPNRQPSHVTILSA